MKGCDSMAAILKMFAGAGTGKTAHPAADLYHKIAAPFSALHVLCQPSEHYGRIVPADQSRRGGAAWLIPAKRGTVRVILRTGKVSRPSLPKTLAANVNTCDRVDYQITATAQNVKQVHALIRWSMALSAAPAKSAKSAKSAASTKREKVTAPALSSESAAPVRPGTGESEAQTA